MIEHVLCWHSMVQSWHFSNLAGRLENNSQTESLPPQATRPQRKMRSLQPAEGQQRGCDNIQLF